MPRLRPAAEKKEPPKTAPELKSEGFEAPEPTETELPFEQREEQPAAKEKAEQDEAALALKKQIDELKKSEELQRNLAEQRLREREEALKQAREHAARVEQFQKEMQDQEEVAVGSALAAAKAEAEKALLDYKNALDAGDTSAQAEAMDKLTDAKANLRILERGKEEIEQRKKAAPPKKTEAEQQQRPPVQTGDPIDSFDLPEAEKNWLRAHRQYVTNRVKSLELGVVHERLLAIGLQPGNPQYLPEIEKGLREIKSLPPEEGGDEPVRERTKEQERSSIVSAPVSREAPSGGGQRKSKVDLTNEEREFARIAGVTEVEYARQKLKLAEEKTKGQYGEQRYG